MIFHMTRHWTCAHVFRRNVTGWKEHVINADYVPEVVFVGCGVKISRRLDFLRGVCDKPPVNAWHNDVAPRWRQWVRLFNNLSAQAATKSPSKKRAIGWDVQVLWAKGSEFWGPREVSFGFNWARPPY